MEDKIRIIEEGRTELLLKIKTILKGIRIDEARSILKSMFQYLENVTDSITL